MSILRLSANLLLVASLLCWAGCKTTPAQKPATTAAKKSAPAATAATNAPAKGNKGQIDAFLESTEMAALKVVPRAWSDFTIIEAVSHGARVKKGDVLVRCETDKIKEQIADLEQDSPAAKLAL
jgi:hypothetical protein